MADRATDSPRKSHALWRIPQRIKTLTRGGVGLGDGGVKKIDGSTLNLAPQHDAHVRAPCSTLGEIYCVSFQASGCAAASTRGVVAAPLARLLNRQPVGVRRRAVMKASRSTAKR